MGRGQVFLFLGQRFFVITTGRLTRAPEPVVRLKNRCIDESIQNLAGSRKTLRAADDGLQNLPACVWIVSHPFDGRDGVDRLRELVEVSTDFVLGRHPAKDCPDALAGDIFWIHVSLRKNRDR